MAGRHLPRVHHQTNVHGVESTVNERPVADKAAQPQVSLDQGRCRSHRRLAVQPLRRDQRHFLPVRRQRPNPHIWRGKMMMVQPGQRLCQRDAVGAMKACDAEKNFDPAFQHIVGQSVPKVEHCHTAPMVSMHAGPAQFQQPPTRGKKRAKIIFGFGIELTRCRAPVARHYPVGPDHMVQPRRVTSTIYQHQMVKKGVECIPLQPRGMVDKWSVATQFGNENLISQALRGGQVFGRRGKPQDVEGVIDGHRHPFTPWSLLT